MDKTPPKIGNKVEMQDGGLPWIIETVIGYNPSYHAWIVRAIRGDSNVSMSVFQQNGVWIERRYR